MECIQTQKIKLWSRKYLKPRVINLTTTPRLKNPPLQLKIQNHAIIHPSSFWGERFQKLTNQWTVPEEWKMFLTNIVRYWNYQRCWTLKRCTKGDLFVIKQWGLNFPSAIGIMQKPFSWTDIANLWITFGLLESPDTENKTPLDSDY